MASQAAGNRKDLSGAKKNSSTLTTSLLRPNDCHLIITMAAGAAIMAKMVAVVLMLVLMRRGAVVRIAVNATAGSANLVDLGLEAHAIERSWPFREGLVRSGIAERENEIEIVRTFGGKIT